MDREKINLLFFAVFGAIVGIGILGLVANQGGNASALALNFWPFGKLSAPHSITATLVPDLPSTTVLLTWSDNNRRETGFSIERSVSSEVSGFVVIGTTGKNETGYLDQEISSAAATYYYRVRALKKTPKKIGYSPYSDVASITIPGGSGGGGGKIIYGSHPIFEKLLVPTNTLSNGERVLLRFKVTAATDGRIAVSKFTLKIATTTAAVTDLDVYAFTNSSFSTPVSGISTDGGFLIDNALPVGNDAWESSESQLEFRVETSAGDLTTLEIPAGSARYFEVRGNVSESVSGASISTQLQGDGAYPAGVSQNNLVTVAGVEADVNNDFIWSPISTSTGAASVNDNDWTNGFRVEGLPNPNMEPEVLSQ